MLIIYHDMYVCIYVYIAQRKELLKINTATEFTSGERYREAKRRHVRHEHEPQDRYRTPLTSAQEYGWYNATPVEVQKRRPKKSCPETLFASEMVKSGMYN